MTETELQQLSRDAAKVLSNRYSLVGRPLQHGGFFWWDGIDAETADRMDMPCSKVWLHECTEACTEIMVRVLWPAGKYIIGDSKGAWQLDDGSSSDDSETNDDDPMLAFRIAVLRALIALEQSK